MGGKKNYKQAPLLPKLPSAVFHGGEEAKSKLSLNFSPRCPFNGQRDPPGPGQPRVGGGERAVPAPSGAVRAEVNLPRAGGDRPRQSPGMGMGLCRGLRAGVATSKMNRGGGTERRIGGPRIPPCAGSSDTGPRGLRAAAAAPRCASAEREGPGAGGDRPGGRGVGRPPPPRPARSQRRRRGQEPWKDGRALFEDLGVNMK